MSPFTHVIFLTTLWVLLWGELSIPNVLSGVAVAVLLMVVFPSRQRRPSRWRGMRPIALLRLTAYVIGQLAVSNAVVTREILTRGSKIRTAIVACRLRSSSDATMTAVANIVALSPGMMVVDARTEPPTLYVHVLHFRDVIDTRRRIAHLEMLIIRAIGAPDELDIPAPGPTGRPV